MGITGLQTYDSSNAYNNFSTGRKSSSDEKNANISDFIKKFQEARQITAQELKEDKDWRDMTDSEWDKLLSGIDKYIDTAKEQIKEMEEKQKEAAQKAAVKAAPDQRTTAASSAALHAAAGGSVDAVTAQSGNEENQTGQTGSLRTKRIGRKICRQMTRPFSVLRSGHRKWKAWQSQSVRKQWFSKKRQQAQERKIMYIFASFCRTFLYGKKEVVDFE